MAKGRCPICGNVCRVAADGNSGYCRRAKKKWTKEMVPVKDLQPGPIQHPEVPRALLDMMRWNHSVVGHYLHPTLEQWELGFMRDLNIVGEVGFWCRVAFAFIDYHRRKGIPLRSEEEERKLIGTFVGLGSGASKFPADGLDTIREIWGSPAGFAEEAERVRGIDITAPWSPPDHVKDWPTK